MKLNLKLVTVGKSVGIIIPIDVLEKLGLKKGERVEIDLKKVKED